MTVFDLNRLPPPQVVETIDYEALLAERKAELIALFPEDQQATLAATLELESEPLTKHLQENAYREMVLRKRINEAAQAGMLATALGADLDNIAARYQTERKAGETDESLRTRTQLAFYQISAAGPRNRYRLAALAAHSDVTNADAWQHAPGVVYVSALGRDSALKEETSEQLQAIGHALYGEHNDETLCYIPATNQSPALQAANARLYDDDTRVLGVDLRTREPIILTYTVTGVLVVPPGPDPEELRQVALKQISAATKDLAKFRVDITLPALKAAAMAEGARTVELQSPSANIVCNPGELAVCIGVNLTVEIRHD